MTLNLQRARNGEVRPRHDGRILRDSTDLSRVSQMITVFIRGELPSPAPVEEEDDDEEDDDDDEEDDDEEDDDEEDDDDDAPIPG